MIIPPISIIISLLFLKNKLKAFTDDPKIKKVVEIPKTKNKVFLNKELFNRTIR